MYLKELNIAPYFSVVRLNVKSNGIVLGKKFFKEGTLFLFSDAHHLWNSYFVNLMSNLNAFCLCSDQSGSVILVAPGKPAALQGIEAENMKERIEALIKGRYNNEGINVTLLCPFG